MNKASVGSADISGDINGDITGEIKRLDWAQISTKLYVQADFYLKGMPEVFNEGTSAKDIVHNMLLEFFASKDLCGWDPAKVAEGKTLEAGLKSFLGLILERRMIDEVRVNSRRSFVAIDSENTAGYARRDGAETGDVIRLEDRSRSVENDVQLSELQDSLIKKAAGDEIAIGMIKAATEITGGGKVDQDLAELVIGNREATDEIIKARKRLQRRLKTTKGRCEPWKRPMRSSEGAATTKERPPNERSAS